MRAIVLAAGRGERMGELTTHVPKPLLRVAGHYLIEYSIFSLVNAGINDIVINICYQREQIKAILGDGKRYGATFFYSEEKERLETGGGILHALPLLGDGPFVVLSSDVISDYSLRQLPTDPDGLAHVVMVTNPVYHPQGDFGLCEGRLDMDARPTLTFGNISVLRRELFAGSKPGHFRLGSTLLIPAILNDQVTGEHYQGTWYNIGTPADLEAINQRAREDSNLRPLASETNTLSN
jgi:N-acetyl-alpha-D-muramate 1-phosphate uridylyltransferase